MRMAIGILLIIGLAACSSDQTEDLKQFVAESGQGLRGKVEPLPEIKPYEPFTYKAFDLPDPFKPRKLQPAHGGGGLQPDLNRPKEPLESYALENLKMVGVLQQNKVNYAIIKTPDNSLYRVKVGNYMGQNFGVIAKINAENGAESVLIKEIVQDSAGDWTERESSLQLQEEQEQKK
jgi:type IV pilus assembly protein PilP